MRAIASNRVRAGAYELTAGTASVGYAVDAHLTGVRTAVNHSVNPVEVVWPSYLAARLAERPICGRVSPKRSGYRRWCRVVVVAVRVLVVIARMGRWRTVMMARNDHSPFG
jgi:hypothetical protein